MFCQHMYFHLQFCFGFSTLGTREHSFLWRCESWSCSDNVYVVEGGIKHPAHHGLVNEWKVGEDICIKDKHVSSLDKQFTHFLRVWIWIIFVYLDRHINGINTVNFIFNCQNVSTFVFTPLASNLGFPWLSLKASFQRLTGSLLSSPCILGPPISIIHNIWVKARGRILGVGSTHVPLKFTCSRCLDPFRLSLLVDLGNLGIMLNYDLDVNFSFTVNYHFHHL